MCVKEDKEKSLVTLFSSFLLLYFGYLSLINWTMDTPSSDELSPSSSSSSATCGGSIAVSIFGTIICILLLLIGAWWLYRRYMKNKTGTVFSIHLIWFMFYSFIFLLGNFCVLYFVMMSEIYIQNWVVQSYCRKLQPKRASLDQLHFCSRPVWYFYTNISKHNYEWKKRQNQNYLLKRI